MKDRKQIPIEDAVVTQAIIDILDRKGIASKEDITRQMEVTKREMARERFRDRENYDNRMFVKGSRYATAVSRNVVPLRRFERPATGLGNQCSIHLSYRGTDAWQ